MFFRQKEAESYESTSRVRIIVMILAVLAAVYAWYGLISFNSAEHNALTGEIVLGSNGTALNHAYNGSPVTAFILDYFGACSYLLPFVVIYLGYVLITGPYSLRRIDFFHVGLRLLGFNCLVIGLTALCSFLFYFGATGGGGVLGDFLGLLLGTVLPDSLIPVAALLVVLAGICLITTRSPLWYCDTLGGLVTSLIGIKDKAGEVQEEDDFEITQIDRTTGRPLDSQAEQSGLNNPASMEPAPAEPLKPQPQSPAAAPVFGSAVNGSTGSEAQSGSAESAAMAAENPGGSRHRARTGRGDRHEPSFGDAFGLNNGQEGTAGAGAGAAQPAPAVPPFGAAPLNAGQNGGSSGAGAQSVQSVQPSVPEQPAPARSPLFQGLGGPVGGGAGAAPVQQPEAAPVQIKPAPAPSSRPAAGAEAAGAAGFKPAGVQPREITPDPNDQRPDTIVTAGYDPHLPPAPVKQVYGDDTDTIVTDYVPPAPPVQVEPEPAEPEEEAAETAAGEEEISTIITEGSGRSSVPAAGGFFAQAMEDKKKKEQQAEEEITTIVTSTPEHLVHPQQNPEVPASPSPAAVREPFIPVDPFAPAVPATGHSLPGDQLPPEAGVPDFTGYAQDGGLSAAVPAGAVPPDDPNVINFTDYNNGGIPAMSEDELPQSFIPLPSEEEKPDEPFLRSPGRPSPSEKDPSYQQGLRATRGVFDNRGPVQPVVIRSAPLAEPPREEEAPQSVDEGTVEIELPDLNDGSTGGGNPPAFIGQHNSNASNLPSYMAQGQLDADPEVPATVMPTMKPSQTLVSAPTRSYGPWRPGVELLTSSPAGEGTTLDEVLELQNKINLFMQNFSIRARVAQYVVGPVIIRFDLQLEPGIKSATIANLENDLCRALLVATVRVVSVVPGTPYVGIEVPNPRRKLITLRDVAEQPEFTESRAQLPVCLGSSITGDPVVFDLATAPHLLVAGTTGSGKSAGLNTMLLSLLLRLSPEELRLILIDPKRLEFSTYDNLPHLITPVITDIEDKVMPALRWCIEEMERRYALLTMVGVRKLSEYNALVERSAAAGRPLTDPKWSPEMGGRPDLLRRLPSIVVVVEEFADLMAQFSGRRKSGDSPETAISRLAAKSRAAGIYLVMATQTPRAEVVTGPIRANIPSRLAFKVISRTESSIILDEGGAEKLLGNGDMLCKILSLGSQTLRVHGAYSSNEDVANIVSAWKEHGGLPEYVDEIGEEAVEEEEPAEEVSAAPKLDPLFDQAAAFARDYYAKKQKAPPISDFQTQFGVGYPRAKRLMAQLVREGVVED